MTDMAEREDAEATAVLGERENDDSGAVVSLGDGWDNDDGAGQRPEDEAGHKVVVAFGRTMKTLRLREGLERGEFGKRLGYSASTIASFEQGRRIPSPKTIERADEVLSVDGLLCLWKDEVERAQYPTRFQGMAKLEKECVELLTYDALIENCYWARTKNASGEFDAIIANANLQGQGRVTVKKGEYFETTGCQKWTRVG